MIRTRMLAIGLATCLAAAAAAQAREQLFDGVAAQVGSSVVLHSEVLELSGAVEERSGAPFGTETTSSAGTPASSSARASISPSTT